MDALDQKKSDSAHILPKENLTAHQETEKQQDLLDKDAQKITTCSVPSEASAFLGAVGAFLVLLVIFYLYLSKKLCFTTIGGFPCCDKPLNDHREPVSKDLVSVENLNLALPLNKDLQSIAYATAVERLKMFTRRWRKLRIGSGKD
ncbi:unnamed protein product [Larinioides sclopetarius]|uniref:Uncharacterized protein n=1 Tax=Larinioides sclopetarius TaxID=280406 RepID=A0AAV1ZFZ2_9ARAC